MCEYGGYKEKFIGCKYNFPISKYWKKNYVNY